MGGGVREPGDVGGASGWRGNGGQERASDHARVVVAVEVDGALGPPEGAERRGDGIDEGAILDGDGEAVADGGIGCEAVERLARREAPYVQPRKCSADRLKNGIIFAL